MIVFHVDLDNTLIFSYKRDIGREKRCVEVYQGREISFITEKTYELLQKVRKKACIVPTTTRTQEQYRRVNLGIGELPWALVCNGGVLLENGEEDKNWRVRSLELAGECAAELKKAVDLLEKEPQRELEVRFIESMFVFTKCKNPAATVQTLRKELDVSQVDVLHNGHKVYVVPKSLRKGRAVERFREYKKVRRVFAAGDSEFDISMMEAADWSAAPESFLERFRVSGRVTEMAGKAVYSEEVLERILDML